MKRSHISRMLEEIADENGERMARYLKTGKTPHRHASMIGFPKLLPGSRAGALKNLGILASFCQKAECCGMKIPRTSGWVDDRGAAVAVAGGHENGAHLVAVQRDVVGVGTVAKLPLSSK
jgi:hypothetical protein